MEDRVDALCGKYVREEIWALNVTFDEFEIRVVGDGFEVIKCSAVVEFVEDDDLRACIIIG